jgi:hypothetical protein
MGQHEKLSFFATPCERGAISPARVTRTLTRSRPNPGQIPHLREIAEIAIEVGSDDRKA